jgi:hypothetical protein
MAFDYVGDINENGMVARVATAPGAMIPSGQSDFTWSNKMFRHSLPLVVAILWGLAMSGVNATRPATAADEPAADWVSLFNGKDLAGWITGPDKSWLVVDGVITLQRTFDGKEHNSDYLWTENAYGNFILELEFKVPEQANSGVFLRTSDLKDPVYTGIEVQVANSFGRPTLNRGGTAGAIYDCLAPTKNAIRRPGDWNQYRITCRDSVIQVMLNGEAIIDMDLDQWKQLGQNPDGSPNKFSRPLKDFARKGHIGLQDHGRPVWYRNIRIQSLD